MSDLNHFRTFEISQDGSGNAFELSRSSERVVCLAFDGRFGCFCEIAALTGTANAGEGSPSMEDFLEQAGTIAGLHHRGLARLLDYGDDQGVRFYAVEFVDGEALSDFATRVNGLPSELALGLCADLADALCAISVLGLPIAAGESRVTLDDRGRLRVRLVDYPLGIANPPGPRDSAAAVFELAHLLEQLVAGEVIGEAGAGAETISNIASQLRGLDSIHDAAPVLRSAISGSEFITVESRHRPQLLLAQKLFSRGSPEEFLSDDYRVEQVSPAAADPYAISVTRLSESQSLRMHVLPPNYIISDENLPIYESEKSPSVVEAEALWRSEHFRLVSEARAPGFSLSALLRQAGELSDAEVMLLLDRVETAILETRSVGAELAKVHPDNVLIQFEGRTDVEAEGLIRQRPITDWPNFRIALRAHQTMRGLTTLTPNAKQRFVEVRGGLERGETVSNLAVLELYLQLHDSARAEQAEELLDRYEQSCQARAADLIVEEEIEVEQEFEEMVSPIAAQVAEAAGLDFEEEEAETEAEVEFSPLGGGDLFAQAEPEEDFYEDDEADFPVMSPIAVAMGVVEEDLEDGVPAATYADEQEDEPVFGLGAGLLGAEEFADLHGEIDEVLELEEGDEEEIETALPFGLCPLPEDVEEDHDGLPQLDLDEVGTGGPGALKTFLILAAGAILLAGIIAHLTGKAFWLR